MKRADLTKYCCSLLVFISFFCFTPIYAQDFEEEEGCELEASSKAVKLYNKSAAVAKKDKALQFQLLKQAIIEDPDYLDAYWKMARLAMSRENYKAAQKYFEQILEICPVYNIYIHYYLGRIYYGSDKFSKAVTHMTEFMKHPDDIKTDRHFNIAEQIKSDATFYGALYENPVPFEPTNLKGISTSKDEYLPYITADQEVVYFTRKTQEQARGDLFPKIVERFSVSERTGGEFARGKSLPPPFNKGNNEGGACLTIDNLHMYFTMCKSLTNGYNNCDIYAADYVKIDDQSLMDISFMTDELDMTEAEVRFELNKLKESGVDYMWTNIRSIGDKVNSIKSWESQPTISSDGRTMYFASIREGGVGGIDIYKTVKDSLGEWGKPVGMDKNINTTGNEKSPFLHPDRETLYFSSDGHRGLGGFDIFYTQIEKKEHGKVWGPPKNIGFPINSEQDDLGFFVSTDGVTGYFSSNNESDKYQSYGGWDVYEFPLYEDARPKEVLFLKGELKNEEGQAITGGNMEITNVRTKEVTKIDVDSVSGVYAAILTVDDDKKDKFVMNVTSESYAFSSQIVQPEKKNETALPGAKTEMPLKPDNSITVKSVKPPKTVGKLASKKAPLVKQVNIEMQYVTVGQPYRLDNINFATNSSSVLTVESMVILDGFVAYLADHPDMRVAIHGHTDDVGSHEDNLKLSEGRAKSVNDYMILSGIEDNRLNFKGFGETKEIASNNTEEGRARNRRTEFVIESF